VNLFLMVGISIVNIALISYSIFFFMKKGKAFKFINVIYLFIGVLLDFVSTLLMIIGSSKGLITLHGVLGYTALIGMFAELLIVIRTYKDKIEISNKVKWVTKITYIWWIFVYFAGLIMILGR